MSIRGIFFKETTEEPKPVVKEKAAYVPPVITAPVGQVDATSANEFDQYFRNIMDKANLPGPDYFEFAKALDNLKNSGLPEQQKFLAVFAGFAAQGLTPDKLVSAAEQYIQILNDAKVSEFDKSVDSANGQIQNRQNQYDSLVEENSKLAQKMQGNNEKSAQLQGEIITLKGKLESKKTTFNMTFNNFIAGIQKDIQNIKTYLFNGNTTK